jgi:hypothetical protein
MQNVICTSDVFLEHRESDNYHYIFLLTALQT